MSAPKVGFASVVHVRPLTPRMRRIRLVGEVIAGYPQACEGAHVKLLFPLAHQPRPLLPSLGEDGPAWSRASERPWARTYTVAAIDRERQALDVDMVLHGDNGPASRWAMQARPGQLLGLIGPGGPPLYRPTAERFLLVGDPSSLPLLRAVMAKLPADARGDVLVEVPDPGERQPLPERAEMRVRWMRRHRARQRDNPLLLAVQALPRPTGSLSVTLAGESSQVVAVRRHLREAWDVPRTMMYAVPYWKARLDEEAYHDERHRIMDAFEAEVA